MTPRALRLLAGFAALATLASADEAAGQASALTVLDGPSVIDVRSGRAIPNQRVVIEAGTIIAVGPASSTPIPEGATVEPLGGAFVLPGLWDMHVHLEPQGFGAAFPLMVAYGVAGVRDMGGETANLLALRDSVTNGEVLGPTVVTAGRMLDGPTPDWPFRVTVTDSTEAWEAVEAHAQAGVDFIKVHQQMSAEVYGHIAEAARAFRLPIAGHVPRAVTAQVAISEGQRSHEHMIAIPQCGPDGLAPAAEANDRCTHEAVAPFVRSLRDQQIWHTPTLIVHRNNMLQDDDEFVDEQASVSIRPETRAFWDLQIEANGPLPAPAVRQAYFAAVGAMSSTYADADVGLLAGTDLGFLYTYPGISLHDELRLFVEAGLSPAQALRTATLEPARYLDREGQQGEVAEGQRADLLILGGNPLEDIRNTKDIRSVILGGTVLDRATLNSWITASRTAPRR